VCCHGAHGIALPSAAGCTVHNALTVQPHALLHTFWPNPEKCDPLRYFMTAQTAVGVYRKPANQAKSDMVWCVSTTVRLPVGNSTLGSGAPSNGRRRCSPRVAADWAPCCLCPAHGSRRVVRVVGYNGCTAMRNFALALTAATPVAGGTHPAQSACAVATAALRNREGAAHVAGNAADSIDGRQSTWGLGCRSLCGAAGLQGCLLVRLQCCGRDQGDSNRAGSCKWGCGDVCSRRFAALLWSDRE
jgi:hypothetical protein